MAAGKEIGIISDTHGFLDPRVFEAFDNCDEIWHAGDFGDVEISQQLADFKPLRGVYGNIDGGDVRLKHSEVERFEIDGVDVLMIHIGCLLYTSPSPRDGLLSRMPSSA